MSRRDRGLTAGGRLGKLAGDIWRRDRGAGMVEFALLFPILLSLTVGIVEMSNVFYTRNVLNELVRDAARRFAVGALDKAETEQLVLKKLAETVDSKGNVQITETEGDGGNGDVTVALRVPLRDLLLFDTLSSGLMAIGSTDPDLTLSATMLKY